MIVIIDYGMGNLGSIHNMLNRIGAASEVTSDRHVSGADKLILPGVGAFDRAVEALDRLGLLPLLDEQVLEGKTPILGICLGMQLSPCAARRALFRGSVGSTPRRCGSLRRRG